MRRAFVEVVTKMFENDDKVILVLGDIGVYSFKHLFEAYPDRVINIGINEQATIGVLAGLAKEGFHPIFYTIAPFAVERCLEQIKIDIGYQGLGVRIVSVGGSYDYAALGCTHHCPADVALLKTIPGISIYVPGTDNDVMLFQYLNNTKAVYMRLSEKGCPTNEQVVYNSDENVVLVYGNLMRRVIDACEDIKTSIMFIPFATGYLEMAYIGEYKKIAIVEPWYEGTMHYDVARVNPTARIMSIGVPRRFLTSYGTVEDHDRACGLDKIGIRDKLKAFFNG